MKTRARCKWHTRYTGVYVPQTDCKKCARIYAITHPYKAAQIANNRADYAANQARLKAQAKEQAVAIDAPIDKINEKHECSGNCGDGCSCKKAAIEDELC